MRILRESFGAKLLVALAGVVGLLLLVTLLVVRLETSRQVDVVVERATTGATTLFGDLAELQRQQVARLRTPFVRGAAINRLDARIDQHDLIEAGQMDDFLALEVEYEQNLANLPEALIVFTDAEARPVLSNIGGDQSTRGDPAGIGPLAERLLSGEEYELAAYHVVEGRLYSVTSVYLENLSLRPVGTVTFGLPTAVADVERIGSIGGFEACFHVGGSCVVATSGVDENLRAMMDASAAAGTAVRGRAAGLEMYVQPEPLVPDDPTQGHRIVAVPLDEVIAPFARIQRALLLGGAGALALSALVGAALSRSLTRPMRELVAAAGRVAEGDYDTEVAVTTEDEMGALAEAFNEMTAGLLARERYRAVLNKVVSRDVADELVRGDVELGGESREVSVLFADIRGFTPLTEGMEPREVISLLNDCMEYLSQAIDAEGGVVDKYIGDEVMAIFGAPAHQEDHARRAVSAALRMRVGMATFNAQRTSKGQAPLAIGVGINSGVAVAGNMGATDRLNYTVLGDMVNLASRIAGQAGPGQILVSGATLGLVGHGLVAAPLGGRSLKGFSAEVDVFAVESMTAEARG